ncbi:MAG: Maf family protein, partial [bacterium]|nr:Maf family protein [bacterium]
RAMNAGTISCHGCVAMNRTEPAVPRILLASRSPRRRAFLTESGLAHDAIHPGFDDSVLQPGGVSPDRWVAALAYLKAWAGVALREPGHGPLVIGSDTTCIKDGMMIGTPHDAAEAGAMIRRLRSGRHEVVTGVAIIDVRTGERHICTDRALVTVGDIPDAEIDRYVGGDEWRGKAGAYNLRERITAGWPMTFSGDETTIMGLPMLRLLELLNRLPVPA